MRVLVLSLLLAAPIAAAQDAPPPMTALAPGTTLVVGDATVHAPVEGMDIWSDWRESNGIPPVSVASLPLEVAAAAFAGATEETIAWERTLLAVEVSQGSVAPWVAHRWLDALVADPDPRSLVWTGLHVDGSVAALLAPSCMPTDPTVLLTLRPSEQVAAYRNGSSLETPPSLPPDDSIRTALVADGGAAIAASVAFVAEAFAAVGVASFDPPDGCDPSIVVATASLAETGRSDWERIAPGLEALALTRPIPHRLVRRVAVSWYLDTRPAALSALLANWTSGSPAERVLIQALAHGAAGDGEAMVSALDGVSLPDDPYATWVRAEASRHSGEAREALELATAAVDEDPFFAAAYLTRASAQIALGTPNEALRDLEHLRRTFGSDPLYADWISALDRRLR